MNQKLQNLQDEYSNLQYLKNWLNIHKQAGIAIIGEYLKEEYKRACDKQIKIRKQINKLCE